MTHVQFAVEMVGLVEERPGQQLLSHYDVIQIHEKSETLHNRADFETERQLLETALERSVEVGEDNTSFIALCHESLGLVNLALGDWPRAEAELRKTMALAATIAGGHLMRNQAQAILAVVLVEQGRHAEAKTLAANACQAKGAPAIRRLLEKAAVCA